jgi:flavin-dependent dehydrogenase
MLKKKIIIVGGGSAGWMTAATLCKVFPQFHVTLVESPNVPISGVGESTIAGIHEWINLVGINEQDFMKATDATYKLSIRFENFYKKSDGGFHYPFTRPHLDNSVYGTNDWHYKKMHKPETPNSNYAESYHSVMALVNENKFDKNTDNKLPGYTYGIDSAYHFDAVKFGHWLKENICLPAGVEHIVSDVQSVRYDNKKGILGLQLDDSIFLTGDLYIDCTGFKSLLLDKTVKEPFDSYRHMLPNNRAWATRIPYTDKQQQMEPYTNCTALGNGWVWNIPLWSRIGTGYVYSDDHATPEQALNEFKMYLSSRDVDVEKLEFKDLQMRVGLHNRLWVKNCVAIGLSAGFIEPLESNGLYTVHKFLVELTRTLLRSQDHKGVASRFDIDGYNAVCKKMFKDFANFVSMHYAMTQRTDTPYWNDCYNRQYDPEMLTEQQSITVGGKSYAFDRLVAKNLVGFGFPPIASGMGYNPVDKITEGIEPKSSKLTQKQLDEITKRLDNNKDTWAQAVKHCQTMYDYLNSTVYKE